MIISCNQCNIKFEIESNLIPEEGRLLQCSSCDHKWFYKQSLEQKIESISSGFFNNKKTREETFSDKVLKNYEGKTHPSKSFGKFIVEN